MQTSKTPETKTHQCTCGQSFQTKQELDHHKQNCKAAQQQGMSAGR